MNLKYSFLENQFNRTSEISKKYIIIEDIAKAWFNVQNTINNNLLGTITFLKTIGMIIQNVAWELVLFH